MIDVAHDRDHRRTRLPASSPSLAALQVVLDLVFALQLAV